MDIKLIETFEPEELIKMAYRYAMRLVSMRNYSYKKLLKKITEKNYPKEIAQAAIDKLKAEGYYKEEYYTNSAIRKHIRKGRTPDLVKRYLNEEGIQLSVAEITEKSGEINNNEYSAIDQIDELILKKQSILAKWTALEKEDKYKAEQKLLRYLVAKGHQLGACRTAIKKYIETNLTGEDSY